MLLILTSNQDLTADYLIVELIRRRLPYFRLNSEELSEAKLSFSLDSSATTRRVSINGRTLDLDRVTAVWYRRAVHPTVNPALDAATQRFIAGELRHLAMGILLNPAVTWVNPIDKVSIAEHKLYQLRLASALGLQTPRTLVSADVEELRDFASANEIGTIYKPIFHGLFFDGTIRHAVYTRQLDIDELNAESLSACPILVQEQIPRISDVRATFIGPRCFVAEIRADIPLVDWRQHASTVDYIASSLDNRTVALCRQMLSKLDLVYGAFDFLRTTSGELIFLEVNPTGEWAWLEGKLEFPMRDAFVEVFFGQGN